MTLFDTTFYGSVIIVVVVIIRVFAINKLPQKTFKFLLGISVCRLLIPFSIPSRISFYTAIRRLGGPSVGQGTISDPTLINMGTILKSINNTSQPVFGTGINPIVIIWLAGVMVLALFFLITHFRCRTEYKTALPINNRFVEEWVCQHKIMRPIRICQSDKITAPLTYGIWRPVVLLPKTVNWTDERQLQYILTHEFIHIKQFDTLTKWLLAVCLCIHWFNPLVWAMYVFANRDIEISCDETVLRTLGESLKSSYALAIIGLEETRSALAPLCSGFSKDTAKERITAIMKYKTPSKAVIAFAAFLVIGTTAMFAFNAAVNEDIGLSGKEGEPVLATGAHILLAKADVSDQPGTEYSGGFVIQAIGEENGKTIYSVNYDNSEKNEFRELSGNEIAQYVYLSRADTHNS